jgi:hypothetical protein
MFGAFRVFRGHTLNSQVFSLICSKTVHKMHPTRMTGLLSFYSLQSLYIVTNLGVTLGLILP